MTSQSGTKFLTAVGVFISSSSHSLSSLATAEEIQPFEILLSQRTQPRELRQSNPEIRRSLGFFPLVLPATFRCLASSVPGHVQKQGRILDVRAVARCVQQEFSKQHALCLVSHVHFLSPMQYQRLYQCPMYGMRLLYVNMAHVNQLYGDILSDLDRRCARAGTESVSLCVRMRS